MPRRHSRTLPALASVLLLATLGGPLNAQEMTGMLPSGPVITAAGPSLAVPDPSFQVPEGHLFRVVWEIVDRVPEDEMNAELTTVARFLNLHARHGVELENIRLAAVVHGGGWGALLNEAAWGSRFDGTSNPSMELVQQLIDAGVEIVLCGQTAMARQISQDDLLPGVKIAWSAMTALHWFQSQGYTFNPW